jgi:hypothetical protein
VNYRKGDINMLIDGIRNDCLPEFIKKAMPSNAMIKFLK